MCLKTQVIVFLQHQGTLDVRLTHVNGLAYFAMKGGGASESTV